MKTLVVISDLHCGSAYGLTPPRYFQDKRHAMQEEAWRSYKHLTRKWNAPDILLVNGDAIEGNQSKQGGAELSTSDRLVQAEMAVECIEQWRARKILMTFGTKYHVGDQAEDFEYTIAHDVGATIEGRLYFKVEGLTVDARHKVGTSNVPYGRATSLMKELTWDLIKEAQNTGPKVDIVIRSHAHYYLWVEQANKAMLITPCLQLARGRYGSRECIGETHWGAIRLTIHKGQIIKKDVELCTFLSSRPSVIRIK